MTHKTPEIDTSNIGMKSKDVEYWTLTWPLTYAYKLLYIILLDHYYLNPDVNPPK